MDNKIELKTGLLVAGGGISGMCAAIAAARKGMKVVLINDRSVLGGNASSEIGVAISGSSCHGLNGAVYAKETGIVNEIRNRIKFYRLGDGYGNMALLDAVFFDVIYAEPNIQLILNTVVEDCEVEDGKITKAYARHSVNNNLYEIVADYYIDATGNGTLALMAGAEYRVGREGKNEYGEFWAPDEADARTMGNSIYFETEDAGHPVSFKAPDYAHDISNMEFMKDIDKPENFRGLSCYGPHWAYEYGGQVDILNDHDDIELELRKLIYGIWDYIKNSGKYPQAKNRRLKRVYAKAGTRESRRFIGDYVLNENDIENKVDFEDSVAMGGWPMDIHATKGIYDSLPASNFVPVTGTYNIPFRSLYTKDIDNLMLAGRNISASHIALGSTRVMATCGAIGQATGTAAYLCEKYGKMPRQLVAENYDELKGMLISDDQSILHREEEVWQIPVCASSEKAYENTIADGFMPLERDYALSLPVDTDIVNSVSVRLSVKKDTILNYKVFTGIHPETYLPQTLLKTDSIELDAGLDDWVKLPLNVSAGADKKLYIVLVENDAIDVGISKNRTLGAVTMRMHTESNHKGKNHDSVPLKNVDNYISKDHTYDTKRNILFRDIEPKQRVFSAENVLNGYRRPYGVQNMWQPQSPCNEWLCLKPNRDVKTLEVVFDDNLEDDLLPLESLARNIEVTVVSDGVAKSIRTEDNYKRTLKYDISQKNVSEIKIKIIDTYGGVPGIYAVRLS